MCDIRLLDPMNSCWFTGYETIAKHLTDKQRLLLRWYDCDLYVDNFGNQRLVHFNPEGVIISAVLFHQSNTLLHIYVDKLWRRRGEATSLLLIWKMLGYNYTLDSNLTEEGTAFFTHRGEL